MSAERPKRPDPRETVDEPIASWVYLAFLTGLAVGLLVALLPGVVCR